MLSQPPVGLVASPGKVSNLDGWKALAGELSAAAEKLRPLGMTTGFHNHQPEWRVIEGDLPMDLLAARPTDHVRSRSHSS